MKHTGRKKLGILLLLIMCFSVFPINTFAREDTAADRESGKRTAESAGHLRCIFSSRFARPETGA